MTAVAVVVPWRDAGIAHRSRARHAVRDWFASRLPEAPLADCDGDGPEWSLAAARNAGVRAARAAGADVVVVCDADNVPEEAPLREAIAACQETGLVHLPYVTYRNGDFAWNGSIGGIYVTTPDAWSACGGQDERFRGWGCEDHAFAYAHATLLGEPLQRHDGVLTHFPHPAPPARDPGHPHARAAAALLRRYIEASGDRRAMGALVEERVRG